MDDPRQQRPPDVKGGRPVGKIVSRARSNDRSQSAAQQAPPAQEAPVVNAPDSLDAILARLSPPAREALGNAERVRIGAGSGQIHMEHLLLGLYRTADGPANRLISEAKISEEELLEILERAAKQHLPVAPEDVETAKSVETPTLSRHARAAMIGGAQTADAMRSELIQTGHLFFGAMSVEACSPVEELARRGVDKDQALALERLRAGQQEQPPPGDETETVPSAGTEPAPETLTVGASAQTDQPTAHDLLGYTGLVDALADLLTGSDTTFPLTIGISAPWGGGKSSIMRLLDGRLREQPEDSPWVIVYFPAWRYETGEQLWAAMAKAAYDEGLRIQGGLLGRIRFRWDLERKRGAVPRFAARAGAPVLAAIAGVLLGNLLGSATGAPAGTVATVGGIGGFVGVAQALWGALADPFKRAVESFAQNPGVHEGDGFTPEAAAQVNALMELLLERGQSVAIFIDDLDRCTPRNLVRVIEAVNQIFIAGSDVAAPPSSATASTGAAEPESKPRRIVFVMGMDRQVVARGIEAEYHDLKALLDKERDPAGRDYGLAFLDKIIQLWVTLPTPSRAGLEVLLRTVAGFPSDKGPDNEAVINRFKAEMAAATRDIPPDDRAAIAAAARKVREQADEASRAAATWAGESFLSTFTAGTAKESERVWNAMQEGATFLEPNPRQVKRFNNAFRLQLNLAARSFDVTFSPDQLGALARWVAIRLRWAELAHDMDDYDDLLWALETVANVPTPDAADAVRLARQKVRTPTWFTEDDFPELPELLSALKAERPEQQVSRLPFGSFVRAA
jgi:hypothetical protein